MSYKNIVPIQGIENKKIINFDLAFNIIKKNIYNPLSLDNQYNQAFHLYKIFYF